MPQFENAGEPRQAMLPGCNIMSAARSHQKYSTHHVQVVSKLPLDLNVLAKAIGVLVQKNDTWSSRTEKTVYSDADDGCSSDHFNLQSFYNKDDAVDDVGNFVRTLNIEAGISDACLVIAVIFADRVKNHVSIHFEETFLLQRATARRLLAVGSLIASKCFDVDAPPTMWAASRWASATGIAKDELILLERRLLGCLIETGLFVHWQEFALKRSLLEDLGAADAPPTTAKAELLTPAVPSSHPPPDEVRHATPSVLPPALAKADPRRGSPRRRRARRGGGGA
jgi:hypothetical protein